MTIIDAWNKQRIEYQKRYINYLRDFKRNPENTDNRGHMCECSYVLISVFGLTTKQILEVERNDGLTDNDLKDMKDYYVR